MQLMVWTVGHSTKSEAEFLELLKTNRVEALADVRRFPGSKRYPQFAAERLRISLPEKGIEYVHFPELGGRRTPTKDSPNTAWRNEAFRGYADYMLSAEFQSGMERLTKLELVKRTAIMCAEAVWWRCHRALISDLLKSRGWSVMHIMSETNVYEHPYTSAASIINGQLTYLNPAVARA